MSNQQKLGKLKILLQSSNVKRWHMYRTIKEENLGQHHCMVAHILLALTNPSKNLLIAALTHDVGEGFVGDIPSPTKDNLGLREIIEEEEDKHNPFSGIHLTSDERWWLKFADILARLLYSYQEIKMGNRGMQIVHLRTQSILMKMVQEKESEKTLLIYLTMLLDELV